MGSLEITSGGGYREDVIDNAHLQETAANNPHLFAMMRGLICTQRQTPSPTNDLPLTP